MTYEQKDNSGSTFKNDQRTKDTQPNMKGKCMIEGVMYWMDSWTKESKNGNKFQTFAFKRMEDKYIKDEQKEESKEPDIDIDDIPF